MKLKPIRKAKKMNIRLLIIGMVVFLFGCKTEVSIQSYQYNNIRIDQLADSISDPTFMAMLKPYRSEIEEYLNQVLAVSDVPLDSYRPESPLGNLASDIVYEMAQYYSQRIPENCTVDLSLINFGGIRGSLPQGEIKMTDVFSVMPFENEMVLIQVTGVQLKEMFDNLASRDGGAVSRASFGIKEGKAVEVKINRSSINPDRLYWLATSDYLANGGDGMHMLVQAQQKIVFDAKIRDAIVYWLRMKNEQGQKITSKIEGRVYHVE